jgi:sugar lactone lactonase YvrE
VTDYFKKEGFVKELNFRRRMKNRFILLVFVIACSAWTGSSIRADILYVSQATCISSISSNGNVSTFIVPDNTNQIGRPMGLAIDSHGNIFVSNSTDNNIVRVAPNGVTSIFARMFSGPPYLNEPYTIAIDTLDNLYAANFVPSDATGSQILKFAPDGSRSLFATGLNRPIGLAVDRDGNVYSSNYGDGTISKISDQGAVSNYASGLHNPGGIALDGAGDLFVADFGSSSIVKIVNGVKNTFVNIPSGPGTVAFDSVGNLYASAGTDSIDRITPDGVVLQFASGVNQPFAIVARVPEPSSLIAWGLGVITLLSRRKSNSNSQLRKKVTVHALLKRIAVVR